MTPKSDYCKICHKKGHKAKECPEKEKNPAMDIISEIWKDADLVIKKDYKILLLGGTGQGKTSFLNFLGNVENALKSKDGIQNC